MHWFNAAGEIGITIAIDSITGTSLWAKTATAVIPPRGATKGAVEISVRTNGGTAYVDDVTVTRAVGRPLLPAEFLKEGKSG